jgi:serine/threonine protein kinase
MTPERWQEVEKLYQAAWEREPSQRAAFLQRACAGDEGLRREVESLLAYQQQAESFIEAPALDVAGQGSVGGPHHSLVGRQVGSYKVLSLLGAGGMGEVYRAKDTRLGREVAVKVLPSALASDPDRVYRFKQEARATGALNHPNILAIYDVGTHDGSPYLVSELLEGATLRDQLRGTALSVRKAIDYGLQIARGLAAAHEKGIVHRDLKPENLFVTRDGRVKILDFGLAKLTQPQLDSSPLTAATTNPGGTEPGVVLGTAGYMSPEQVRGQAVDHRSDLFAFGAILYEMLSGRRAFQGKSAIETMNAILKEDPPELAKTNLPLPPALARIVRHCLEKGPEQRFQSASDLAFDLEALLEGQGSTSRLLESAPKGLKRPAYVGWLVAAILFLAAIPLVVGYFHRAPTEGRAVRFTVHPPEKSNFNDTSLSISPDGRLLAFEATDPSGKSLLWVRPLNSLAAWPLPGSDRAGDPFWSADSRFVGFFAGGKLKKIELSGGSAQTLCDVPAGLGGTWNRDGVILFAANFYGPLYRVPAAGGEPSAVTALDPSRRENAHLFPQFLPDGRHFLYLARSAQKQHTGIYLGSLDSKDTRRLVSTESNAAYTPPGYLLFVREGTLMVQPFSAKTFQLEGEPSPVAPQVAQYLDYRAFSASQNGVLAYRSDVQVKNTQLVWVDRAGKRLGPVGPPGYYRMPRLSPDETRVAVENLDPQTGRGDIWLLDLSRGTSSRFTFDPADDAQPTWSPDGNRIIFRSQREGSYTLYEKSSNGTGKEEMLLQQNDFLRPEDWSPDGRLFLYATITADNPKSFTDLWVLPLFGERKPMPYLQTEFWQHEARFSPDGRWIAYRSDESGKMEIYVQSFPAPSGRVPVSTEGGVNPSWRGDGKELFYLAADQKLMAVEVKSGATFQAGVPRALFLTRVSGAVGSSKHYTVTKDGQRFLVNMPVEGASSNPITIVLNWTAELRR